MKKIFTIAAALMVSMAMMAETETHPSSASSNETITGTSYTLDGNFNAGVGGSKAGDMQTKGIKFRLNRTADNISNAVKFAVNEGYIISEIAFCGQANDGSKTASVDQVIIDGTPINFTPVTLPVKTSSVSFVIDGFSASQSIILVFSGQATQANIEYTVTYGEGEISTDPVLNAAPEEVALNATAAQPQASASVTFTGKNLVAGSYPLTLPNVAGLSVNPSSVTVGEDGKLNAEVSLSYTSAVDVAAASTTISLTIGELTKNVTVNYSADLAKNYLNRSMNIEQWVLDNGQDNAEFKNVLAEAGIEYHNIDALDTLNDLENKTARNYAFLGLKMKKADAKLACWLQAGHTISVRFGNVGANFIVRANGQAMTLTDAVANTTVESDTALTLTAPMDMYLEIICNSTKTLVVKQIMLDEDIEEIELPKPNAYLITIAECENGEVTASWANKKYRTPVGAVVTLNITSDAGYILHDLTYNDIVIEQSAPGAPITFVMPAEDVTVQAIFSDVTTAVDNIEAEVKAVKMIRNGQLLIEKNGIIYNAQGVEIK